MPRYINFSPKLILVNYSLCARRSLPGGEGYVEKGGGSPIYLRPEEVYGRAHYYHRGQHDADGFQCVLAAQLPEHDNEEYYERANLKVGPYELRRGSNLWG